MDPRLVEALVATIQTLAKSRWKHGLHNEEEMLCYHSCLRAMKANNDLLETVLRQQIKLYESNEPPEKDDRDPPGPETVGPTSS